MLKSIYKSGYGWSLLSVLCVHFLCISAYGYRAKWSSTTKNHQGSGAVTTHYVVSVSHKEEITLVELFEEKCNIFNV